MSKRLLKKYNHRVHREENENTEKICYSVCSFFQSQYSRLSAYCWLWFSSFAKGCWYGQ